MGKKIQTRRLMTMETNQDDVLEAAKGGQESLPPLYKSIIPLIRGEHEKLAYIGDSQRDFSFAAQSDAIALTVEEFVLAMSHYPIVFSKGENPMPVVLTGVPGKGNQYVDSAGRWRDGVYVPAYIRRYPFILAKLAPESTDLSLCFDETSKQIVEADEDKLFKNGEPSEITRHMLQLCEGFEAAVRKTQRFMSELEELDLLMDAQAEIRGTAEPAEPVVFQGFQIISEDRIHTLRGPKLRKLTEPGMLGLVYSHVFSLRHIKDLFELPLPRAEGRPN
ncbi:MAG: SapC family protein [Rhodospirillales bacterium]|nr:SapC family protein [Rhodospirillales bacterium]